MCRRAVCDLKPGFISGGGGGGGGKGGLFTPPKNWFAPPRNFVAQNSEINPGSHNEVRDSPY